MQLFRTMFAAAASSLVALGLVVAPVTAPAASALTTPSAVSTSAADPASGAEGKTTVTVSPASRGIVHRDEDLTLSVTVTNDTDQALPAGSAELDISRVVSSRDQLSDWLADTSTTGYPGAPMDTVDVPAVPAHRSVTLRNVQIVPGNVGLGGYGSFGPRRIAAVYTAGGTTAIARSAITWYPDFEQTPVGVSVAMPITLPASSTMFVTPDELAAATAVDGTLTQQLRAVEGHNVAVGIDPRIIASIRILGQNAPSSAIAWLQELEGLRNETFALPWADADVTGLRQAGADGVLAPISLDPGIDAENFPGASTPSPTPSGETPTDGPTAGAGATAGDTATTAPTDNPTTPTSTTGTTDGTDPDSTAVLPTTASLLDFDYSIDSLAWPVEGTVSKNDLPALRAAGTKTTIVSSGNTSAGADTTIPASERIGSDHVLVADQAMSSLLREAVTATDDRTWDAAVSELTATLASAARDGAATAPVLLALGRDWPSDTTRLTETLSALERTPWAAPTDLTTTAAATPGSLTLDSSSDGDARIDKLERLVRGEDSVSAFSTALDTPEAVTAPARLQLLALASNAWRVDGTGLDAAITNRVAKWAVTTGSVTIADSSSLTLLGDRSSLPISIRNESDFPVTVRLSVQPSNSALRVVRNDIEVKVQKDSSTRTTVPVQSVANGKVSLTMSLTTPTGQSISDPAVVELNVQAQWETVITAVAGIALVAIFGFGIFRSIRKRVRRRRGELDDDDDDDPNRPLADQPDLPGGTAPVRHAAAVRQAAGPAPARSAAAPASAGAAPASADAAGAASVGSAAGSAGAEPRLQAAARGRDEHAEPTADQPVPEEPAISATQPPPAVDAEPVAERSLGRASAMLAAGTMVSRVLGFAKTIILAYAIGQQGSVSADAFAVSNQLPNNIYALIAGGLLSAVLIPQIVRSMQQHADGGTAYVNKIVTLGGSVFLVITVIATALAPVLVGLYSIQGGDGSKGFTPAQTDLAVAFAFWCLPQILFYAMYSLLGEVLNAKQVFGPFTWAPLINNVIAVSGLIVFMALFGDRSANAGLDDWTPAKIAVLAGSATLGVVAQAAFLPFFWRRAGLTFRPDFRWRGVGLKATGTAAGWLFAMILVTQLAGLVQSRVSSLGTGEAGNAVLQNAWLLFMLPHSIITVSIATAYFTRMSHDAERGDIAAVRRNLSLSLRIVGLFTVFASVALMVVSVPFGRIFASTFGGALSIGAVLLAYMPGLVLFSMLFVIQRVFWAMHDHRTPFLMQCVQSVLFVIGALAVSTLPDQAIGFSIAACTTLAGSAQTVLALVLVSRRLKGMEGPNVVRSHLQFIVAALIAGVVGLAVVWFFGAFTPSGFAMADATGAVVTILLTGVVMAAVYFGVLAVARNQEIRGAVDIVRARLGR
ncbi:hypothetical protein GCM10009769_28280 [Curtobacterium luteum]|uniref:Murein biosynthesis integral membrane protein MurJ n=1 Tax=Curtobacterium luteum TaxID=33881 RepID=A0A8H9GDE2_9MICO|nr:DUF6049 family protein [Curtobacterium luteum]GGL08509.1 hypothetical protein GCM10009769_28280 [Curtobacterium luteum]